MLIGNTNPDAELRGMRDTASPVQPSSSWTGHVPGGVRATFQFNFARTNTIVWLVFTTELVIATAWWSPTGRALFGEVVALGCFYAVGAIIIYWWTVGPARRWLVGAYTVALSLRVWAGVLIFVWLAAAFPDRPLYEPNLSKFTPASTLPVYGVLLDDSGFFLSQAWLGFSQAEVLDRYNIGYARVLNFLMMIFGKSQMIGVYWSALLTALAVAVIYRLGKLFSDSEPVAQTAASWGVVFPPFILWGSNLSLDSATILLFPLLVYFCVMVGLRCRVLDLLGVVSVVLVVAFYRLSRSVPFAAIGLVMVFEGLFPRSRTTESRKWVVRRQWIRTALVFITVIGLLLGGERLVTLGQISAVLEQRGFVNHTGHIEARHGTGGVGIYRGLTAQGGSLFSPQFWLIGPPLLGVELSLPIFVQVFMDRLQPPLKLLHLAESLMWTFWLLPLLGVAVYAKLRGSVRLDAGLWLSALLFLMSILVYSAADTATIRWRATAMPLLLIMAAIGHHALQSQRYRLDLQIVRGVVLAGSLLINILYLAIKI